MTKLKLFLFFLLFTVAASAIEYVRYGIWRSRFPKEPAWHFFLQR